MNTTNWRDINDSWAYLAQPSDDDEFKDEEEPQEEPARQRTEAELRLKDPVFVEPEDGYAENKPCELSVSVERLKPGTPRKIIFDVYSVYKGRQTKEFAGLEGREENGVATAKIPRLYFNNDYLGDQSRSQDAAFEYWFEAHHPKAEAAVTSSRLVLPPRKRYSVEFVEVPDVLFNHDSAVPLFDGDGRLVESIVTALAYAADNPGKELVVFGHCDRSGRENYNVRLSGLRARAVKALVDDDAGAFYAAIEQNNRVDDRQTFLQTLSESYGWPCAPGSIDNKDGPKTRSAVESFQRHYNSLGCGSIAVDGEIGPQTWKALFAVVRSLIVQEYDERCGNKPLPSISYGLDGEGICACGESFPVEKPDRDGYESKTNRRVELVFADKGRMPPITIPADPDTSPTMQDVQVYDTKTTARKPVLKNQAASDTLVIEIEDVPDNPPDDRFVCVIGPSRTETMRLADMPVADGGKRVWKITGVASSKEKVTVKTEDCDGRPLQTLIDGGR